ncbi:unknown [[Mannheimia] succiniciproducens MBEL55E]|uniref:Uncharacterized protein n=1 Tax=Mannheimia succiniciproducens (strain KCTC 0769BP / MBEL55E) TaxID=221988 RepID=Q65R14_MANSM|nr:unknown [[Mannheimia] succiniciproducens MBEL55E]
MFKTYFELKRTNHGTKLINIAQIIKRKKSNI